ncbi:MAG: hypothetical protein ACYTGG_00575 [Planctomycetota bacterium]
MKMSEVRAQADGVLSHLLAERAACERQLAETDREDPIRTVTGRSALDDAIVSTRDMIREIDQFLTLPAGTRSAPSPPTRTNGHAAATRIDTACP